MEPDNFDIFEDRVKNLLERWRKFHDRNKNSPQCPENDKACIVGFLAEVNDDYTQALIK